LVTPLITNVTNNLQESFQFAIAIQYSIAHGSTVPRVPTLRSFQPVPERASVARLKAPTTIRV
jgi:hypothetical protein